VLAASPSSGVSQHTVRDSALGGSNRPSAELPTRRQVADVEVLRVVALDAAAIGASRRRPLPPFTGLHRWLAQLSRLPAFFQRAEQPGLSGCGVAKPERAIEAKVIERYENMRS
jgi:hypothetical protein